MLFSHRQPVFHACQAAARAPVDPDDPPPLFDPVAMAAAFPVDAGADSAWWLGVCGMDMAARAGRDRAAGRSEEHTSELQSLMRTSYAVFCLKKKRKNTNICDIILRRQTTSNKSALA